MLVIVLQNKFAILCSLCVHMSKTIEGVHKKIKTEPQQNLASLS